MDTMDRRKLAVVKPGWWFELLIALGALLVVTGLVLFGTGFPAVLPLLLFFGLVVLGENSSVLLPASAAVSPAFMMIMAEIVAFHGAGSILGAALAGLGGGIILPLFRDRRYTTILFNCGQYMLASAAAAVAYGTLLPVSQPAAFASAAAAFAAVNIGLVLPQTVLNYSESAASVWNDMRPTFPNYLAFGLLGAVVGELYRNLHPMVLPLLIVPAIIARHAFAAFTKLREAQEATVRVFISAIEAKDPYTAGHAERVAKYAQYMGEELGFTPSRQEHLRYAALMHDIGKLAVPTHLLNKPGKLTEDEYAVVQRHNHVCVDILTKVDFMKSMVDVASDRHAHYGEDDDHADARAMEAYIITVADAFDAMTSTRSYRKALSMDIAFTELTEKSGSQFHPECAAALIRAIERRGEHYGLGYEVDAHQFSVAPPEVGVGSAGLGDLAATDSMPA
jgi:putative nucleotidyltransferase with HDIG domain